MPFNVRIFRENAELHVRGAGRNKLAKACATYATLTTPLQQGRCIQSMMDVLDRVADRETSRAVMEACGRHCIGPAILEKARRLKKTALDIDDLLNRLNASHIGGGHLRRHGDAIHAAYDRCYCGSVAGAPRPFSDTYCHCSCGWYRQLFETLFDGPVRVELLSSIIRGDDRCRFIIRL